MQDAKPRAEAKQSKTKGFRVCYTTSLNKLKSDFLGPESQSPPNSSRILQALESLARIH